MHTTHHLQALWHTCMIIFSQELPPCNSFKILSRIKIINLEKYGKKKNPPLSYSSYWKTSLQLNTNSPCFAVVYLYPKTHRVFCDQIPWPHLTNMSASLPCISALVHVSDVICFTALLFFLWDLYHLVKLEYLIHCSQTSTQETYFNHDYWLHSSEIFYIKHRNWFTGQQTWG